MGRNGGRYSGIRAGSGEFLEQTGRRNVGGGRRYSSGKVVTGQCGTHWLF